MARIGEAGQIKGAGMRSVSGQPIRTCDGAGQRAFPALAAIGAAIYAIKVIAQHDDLSGLVDRHATAQARFTVCRPRLVRQQHPTRPVIAAGIDATGKARRSGGKAGAEREENARHRRALGDDAELLGWMADRNAAPLRAAIRAAVDHSAAGPGQHDTRMRRIEHETAHIAALRVAEPGPRRGSGLRGGAKKHGGEGQ